MKYIIKIGGSLYYRPELKRVLAHAAGLVKAPHSAVIVPGGGPFADQVRRAQQRWLFADKTAHDMALLAMRQYGLMLAALSGLPAAERVQMGIAGEDGEAAVALPDLPAAEQGRDMPAAERVRNMPAVEQGRDIAPAERVRSIPPGGCSIWLPSEDASVWLPQNRPAPDFDWRLTSDSIAACLAARLGADRLVLIKPVPVAEVDAFSDLVDERFCELAAASNLRVASVSVPEWLELAYITDIEGKIVTYQPDTTACNTQI